MHRCVLIMYAVQKYVASMNGVYFPGGFPSVCSHTAVPSGLLAALSMVTETTRHSLQLVKDVQYVASGGMAKSSSF